MMRVGVRRAPEGHHAVADVFVDGSAVGHDDVGQGAQDGIDQPAEALGIVLEGLRHGGEAPDVGEEDGQLAGLGAQVCGLRLGDQVLDELRRDVLAEGPLDVAAALALNPQQRVGDHDDVGGRRHGRPFPAELRPEPRRG